MGAQSGNAEQLLRDLLEHLGGRRDIDELCRCHGLVPAQVAELKAMVAGLAVRRGVIAPQEPASAPTLPMPAAEPKTDTVVRAREVKRVYRMGHEEVHALRGINLQVYRGEYMSLMGPSGSGKTTLFNMLGALDKPSSGHVYIDEVDVAQLTAAELAWLRCRKIGYIFQTFNIIPVMTSLENVTLPMIFADTHPDVARERGVQLLQRVGLGHRVNHKPFELSGGQQQRVAIARSLANDPAIILADEPTGNLDLKTGEEIIRLLRELCSENGTTIITATHDMKMLSISDRIVWIRDGCVDRIELRKDLHIEVGGLQAN
jgi:putative ABC transport system ATP-binding protein